MTRSDSIFKIQPESLPGHVRPVTTDDALALAQLKVLCWQADYAGLLPAQSLAGLDAAAEAPHWRSWLQDETSGLVASLVEAPDGRLLGYGLAGPMRLGDRPGKEINAEAELYALHIHPDWQRKGLGRALLAHLVSDLIAREYGTMGLWMIGGNHKAGAFLAALKAEEGEKRVEIRSGRIAFREKAWYWPDLKALQARLIIRPVSRLPEYSI